MARTGITWMAVGGDDPLKIQRRAVHSDFATTDQYIRTAEHIREGFGEPFPELTELLPFFVHGDEYRSPNRSEASQVFRITERETEFDDQGLA